MVVALRELNETRAIKKFSFLHTEEWKQTTVWWRRPKTEQIFIYTTHREHHHIGKNSDILC